MKIILISGKMGSGKTTVSNLLNAKLFIRAKRYPVMIKFAQALYEMHDAIIQILNKYGIYPEKPQKTLLQILGTQYVRENLGQDTWVNCLKTSINKMEETALSLNEEYIYICDDMRFCNEFNAFPEALRIRLEADKEIRKQRCCSWRENDTHQSEIDLDSYVTDNKFDMVLDSGKESAEILADKIYAKFKEKFHDEEKSV